MNNTNAECGVRSAERETSLQLQTVEPWQVTAEEIAADEAKRETRNAERGIVPAAANLQPTVLAPIADVGTYLATRKPCMHFSLFDEEESLFVTLPLDVREELQALLGRFVGGGAFGKTVELLKTMSLHQACQRVVRIYSTWNWSAPRFRARFDLWQAKQDWIVLVNRAKAGLAWQAVKRGLPEAFLKFVEARVGEFKRGDGMRQAIFSIHRQWRTGLNHRGELEAIPGYGFWQEWFALNHPGEQEPAEAPLLTGWGYDNLRTILRKRMPKAVRKLLHEGTAAAKPYLPGVIRTRAHLRFMEEVTFDDLKLDYRVIDPESGEVCDMWILLARCTATGLWLGFVQRPAKAREDGSQEHLNLRDMKQLSGLTLEKYGLPPYLSVWKLERGTSTLSEGQRASLEEMLPGSIKFSMNSMLGGKSAAGYREKGKGNSAAKAGHESSNRLVHTMSAGQPGQTGPVYSKRPSDLAAREADAVAIWRTIQLLPGEQRGRAQFPILTIAQSRQHLWNVLRWMNARTAHRLEGFDEVVEWYDQASGLWRNQAEQTDEAAQQLATGSLPVRTRMESPYERAAKLIRATVDAGGKFKQVSPDIIAAFFKHSQRWEVVEDSGEIKLTIDKKTVRFRPLSGTEVLPLIGTKLLTHLNEEDPQYLYCTDGKGAIVGIWVRRDRSSNQDELVEQLRYTQTALTAARAHADELGAREHERLEAVHRSNAELLGEYVQVAEAQPATRQATSDIATSMNTIRTSTKQLAADQKKRAKQLEKYEGDINELTETPEAPAEDHHDFSAEGLL
jgi:hypothetical protein